ncbi:MAG: RecQ family ATP-dependent DNA helicase [Prevotella sp.]|nr:RecQ family ATP-dependent DNA helicase [Prevotella sp.]
MSSYKEILKRYWGYDDFRGIQREIIESIGLGHDTLGLMPTGGGKSITFQVPALAMEGVCIVITPLIALMKDQVHHLRRRGIFAAAIYSGMQHDEILRTLDNCILGRTKFLYVSPERLTSELFVTKLRHMRISFLTVDEAHCISQWGYDFRPSYLEIANIRTLLPEIPILALTATATPQVVDDICEKLTLHATQNAPHSTFNVFRMSFERANLTYLVRHVADKEQELIHILSHTTGAAIVYVRSRRRSKELATALVKAGLEATFYHAGLESDDKDQRQQAWTADRTRIIVATNAFGMGIDKPDVRLVIHYDCPDSIEAYFQEAGRAGRDGQQAYAVLLYNNSDNSKLQQRIDDNFPPREYIRQVYEHMAYYYQIALGDGFGITREFNIDQFCTRFHHFPTRVHSALHILQRAGYIEYDEAPDLQTRVQFLLERQELYRLKDTTPDEERVIVALLRNYGGLFADLGYIDESLIAHDSGIQAAALHQVLTALAQQHIIRYIPRRQIPTIHYLQRRDDPEHIHLSREIYEDRMEQYRLRINAIQHYAQSNGRCRSRMLLEYFGEKDTHDCGHCDVCREQQGNAVDADQLTAAQQAILQLLADHKPHHTTLLHQLPLPSEAIDAALVTLLQDEQIKQEDGFLLLV